MCDARDAEGFGCELADGHEGDHCALWSNRIGKYRKVWTVAAPAPAAPAARDEAELMRVPEIEDDAEYLRYLAVRINASLPKHWTPIVNHLYAMADRLAARVPVEGER